MSGGPCQRSCSGYKEVKSAELSNDKDAKRYQWLRDKSWQPMSKRLGVNSAHEIDQAIDFAIARQNKS